MRKFYFNLFTFIAIVLLFIYPFVSAYLGYLLSQVTGYSKDSINGNWIGKVQIESITRSADTGRVAHIDNQGAAVMRVRIKPVLFSYLDRTDVEAEITDSHGVIKFFDVEDYSDGWCLKWGGSSGKLINTDGDDMLVGKWNEHFTPLQLTFNASTSSIYGRPFKYKLDGPNGLVAYQIEGSLIRSNDVEYKKLAHSIQNSTTQTTKP